MGSKIGNLPLLMKLGRFMQIVDPVQAPAEMNTQFVQPVVDVAAGNDPEEGTFGFFDSGAQPINGVTILEIKIIDDGAAFPFQPGPYRVDGIECFIALDAAGQAAALGNNVSLRLILVDAADDSPNRKEVTVFAGWPMWRIRNATPLGLYWSMTGGVAREQEAVAGTQSPLETFTCQWDGRVCDAAMGSGGRVGLVLEVVNQTAVWPANTTMRVKAVMRKGSNGIVPLK